MKASLSLNTYATLSGLTFAFDALKDALRLIDSHGKLCYINPSANQIFAFATKSLTTPNTTHWMPSTTKKWWLNYWHQLQTYKTYQYLYHFKTNAHQEVSLTITAFLIEYHGQAYSLELIHENQTLAHTLTASSSQNEQYLRTLLDNFPFMVWLKDTDSKLLAANTAYAKVAGVKSTHELVGKTDFDFFPSELAQQYVDGDRIAMQSTQPTGTICPIKDASGKSFWIESYKSSLVINHRMIGTVGYARDVTKTLQSEREYRSLIENSPSSIVRFNQDNKRIFLNAKKADFYQVSPDFLIGKSPSEFPGGPSAIKYEALIQDVFLNGIHRSIDLHWPSGSNGDRVIRSLLAPEFDIDGKIIAVISMGLDVTESIEYESRIHRLAYFDPLTNLPNRTLLTDRLTQAAASKQLTTKAFALVILDIDRFKEINDALGHVLGDLVLEESARRIETCADKQDTVARLGGDEFAILLTDIKGEQGLVSSVQKVMQKFESPFFINGKELFVTLSIGVAVCPLDSDRVEDLFKFADSALYLAKAQGRNNFQFYSKDLTVHASERMSLEASLRKAISKNEFELYYQPQVNLATKEIVGVEALLRWHLNHTQMVAPNKFIAIAEESGLIVDIGEWVIYQACMAAAHWNQERSTPFPVAINLSSRQFIRNDLVATFIRILNETHCQPDWLKLEITESLLLENKPDIKNALNKLTDMGLNISIDDFGTGYSALGYLIHFPVSQIKIDQSFICDITTNKDRGLLVKAIISMANSLRVSIVAEGVETHEQAEFLLSIDCLQAQGYLFGKPMPFERLSALITS